MSNRDLSSEVLSANVMLYDNEERRVKERLKESWVRIFRRDDIMLFTSVRYYVYDDEGIHWIDRTLDEVKQHYKVK